MLLGYYGEDFTPPCGHCDNCRAGDTSVGPSDDTFATGRGVHHPEWGAGTVMTTSGDRIIVWFVEHGYRTLLLDLVVERDLLRLSNT